jgi:hypothetical protein
MSFGSTYTNKKYSCVQKTNNNFDIGADIEIKVGADLKLKNNFEFSY